MVIIGFQFSQSVQSNQTRVLVDCLNSKPIEIKILKTGILNIPGFCIGHCRDNILKPKFNYVNLTR